MRRTDQSSSHPQAASDRSAKGPSCFQRWLRSAALTVVVIAAALIANQAWIERQINEQIRLQIEQQITTAIPELIVQVGSVARNGNHGIRLGDVRISLPASAAASWDSEVIATIDRLDLVGPTDYATLLQQQPLIDEIHLIGGRIHAVRNSTGNWNVVDLVDRLRAVKPVGAETGMPTIRISGLELAIRGAAQLSQDPFVLTFRDTVITDQQRAHLSVDAARNSQQGRVLKVRSQVTNSFVGGIEVQGAISLDDQQSLLSVRIGKLQLTNDWFEYLPLSMLEQFPAGLEIRGQADLAVQLETKLQTTIATTDDPASQTTVANSPVLQTKWVAAGVLANGSYRDRRLPFPITDISSAITWQDGVLRLEKIQGSFGGTLLSAHARISEFGVKPTIEIEFATDKILIDEDLLIGLPQDEVINGIRKTLHTYGPRGTAAIKYHYDNVGQTPRSHLDIQLLDMDLTYEKFPYTLKNATGFIQIHNRDIIVRDVLAQTHGRTFKISADIRDSKIAPRGWLEITSDGAIPLDAELISALDPRSRETIDVLRPTGLITLHRARYEYRGTPGNPYRQIEFDFQQGTLQYRGFPYPIHRINGKVRLQGDQWEFQDFSGYKGNAFVQMQGRFTKPAGQFGQTSHSGYGSAEAPLQMVLTATDVPLDNDLRDALAAKNPAILNTWRSLKPEGALDQVRVSLESTLKPGGTNVFVHGKKWIPDDSLTSSTVSFMPTWFPYRIEGVTGEFIMQDGHVRLTGIHGLHGDTEFQMDGVYNRAPNGQWHFAMDHLSIDRLRMDADLLAAMPAELSQQIRGLDIQGPLQLEGDIYLAHQPAAIKSLHASWRVRLEVAGASIDCGTRLSGMQGGIQFTGVLDDRGFRSSAFVEIDSMFLGNQQITKIQGPLWIDERQILAGTWARATQENRTGSTVIRQPQRPAMSLTGHSFGGLAKIDLQVLFDKDQRRFASNNGKSQPRFMLQASLLQADLAKLARHRRVQERTSGRVDATLRLRGVVGDRTSWLGDGQVRLKQADTYELPLMVALFNKIDIQADRGVFSSTDVDFRIKNDQIVLDRIDLRGDTVSLYGTGWMSFEEEINLNFYSRVGRQQIVIPIINAVLTEASKSLLQIEVVGTVGQPRVNSTAFPELDGAMERILKNLEPRIASPIRDGQGAGVLQLR
ncbi:MAG: hypothetical protein HN617_10555 [Planctomycetaceae bacterium]|jgi:hypothetical protein|nr:hypothetical protein [Planctomycetaceae bacterium]MBT4725948.1 hypothetical protein [Planctomycetaceae bacterium]MBT5124500.1 hypothetical protein [Planctomycetaceae bacterium]MBT5598440.1 hypothetical protein [Planctomycetaceae bacterium]MBT5883888.1 hypothetical protein [Planctomycetaceae bacterium]